MPPHLFASSDEAYRNMMEDKEDQSMVGWGFQKFEFRFFGFEILEPETLGFRVSELLVSETWDCGTEYSVVSRPCNCVGIWEHCIF